MRKDSLRGAVGILSVFLPAVLLPNGIAGNEQPEIPKFSTTVKLSIAAPDEMKNLVDSYLSRELRSLGDVRLVEDDPEWVIDIIGCQVKDKTGYAGGVVFSIVIQKRYRLPVELLLRTVRVTFRMTPDDWDKLKQVRQPLEQTFAEIDSACDLRDLVHHSLRAGSSNDMQSICQEIVANFDTEHLKRQREAFHKVRDELSQHASRP